MKKIEEIKMIKTKFNSYADVLSHNQSNMEIDNALIRKNLACFTIQRAKFLHYNDEKILFAKNENYNGEGDAKCLQ